MSRTLREQRRAMILAMGARCADCSDEFDPDDLVIHHTGFEHERTLGYQSPVRNAQVREYAETGKLPQDVELLCDRCNRKKHGYRQSKKDIFGDRLAREGQRSNILFRS